jgi:stress responsive alpha/beta barrel protein
MKFLILPLLLAFVVTSTIAAEKPATQKETKQSKAETARVFHVVSLKFKDTATKEQIKAVEEAFRDLKKKIPTIASLRWGTNVSPEKHDKGFTHCFILTFANEKDRDDYLKHPDHVAFGKILGPVMADVFVLDFKAKKL